MAIEIISGEDVWSTLVKKNKYQRWPNRQMPERLYPIATPCTQANFKIHRNEKIFCIGSCFAQEISETLHRQDFNVLSLFQDLPKSPNRNKMDASIFHKYNVASIYNELAWALNPATPYHHENALIEVSNQLWQDYQLMGPDYSDDESFAKLFREAFNQAFKRVKEADVVILTLGLSEVWFDKHTQLYLNRTASPETVRCYPGRFELHVFDYGQTLSYLEETYQLLATYLKPSFRLLITVSPIPLSVTFRQQDVLTASAYSKAVLRAAVEQFLCNKANVNYFPSYEFVVLSNPAVVWREDDFRHVNSQFVDYIMANVMAQFTDTTNDTEDSRVLLKVKSLYYGNFIKEAKNLIRPLLAKHKTDKELWLFWGMLQLRLQGSYKNHLFKALIHLKTYQDLSVIQHIQFLFRVYKKRRHKAFVGNLESWDGDSIIGWACCLDVKKPISVTLLINNQKIMTVLANEPRTDVAAVYSKIYLKSGFLIKLDRDISDNQPIHVIFTDTGKNLPGSPIYLTTAKKETM